MQGATSHYTGTRVFEDFIRKEFSNCNVMGPEFLFEKPYYEK
jgi:hypothetical protein